MRNHKPPRQPLFWVALRFSLGLWTGVRAWRPPSWWVIAILTFVFTALWFLANRPGWPRRFPVGDRLGPAAPPIVMRVAIAVGELVFIPALMQAGVALLVAKATRSVQRNGASGKPSAYEMCTDIPGAKSWSGYSKPV